MSVLLAFNEADSWTVAKLAEATQIKMDILIEVLYLFSAQCVHWTVCFSFRPRAVGHIVQPRNCHIIEHIFVPTLSVERNNEKIRFP